MYLKWGRIELLKRGKKSVFIIFIFLTAIILSSCAKNKTVYVQALEPYSYENEGIEVGVPNHQEYWIYFAPDAYPAEVPFYFNSDVLPEYLKVKTVTLKVEDFDIAVGKIIDKTISVEEKSYETKQKYRGNFDFCTYLYVKDLIDAWNKHNKPPVTPNDLYTKFNKIKKITYSIKIEYKIDGIIYEHEYDFDFATRNVTSSRIWDTMMSV